MRASQLSAALVASLIGYGSTIALVLSAAAAVGATAEQTASWVFAICLAKAVGSGWLSARYRMPVVLAWSTPGAALIAASSGVTMAEAVGAFLLSAVLMVLTGLVRPLGRVVAAIPDGIASGMLAGVLLPFCLKLAPAAAALPLLVLPMLAVYLGVRMVRPGLAVLSALVVGVALAFATGTSPDLVPVWPRPEFVAPEFRLQVLLGLGVPLYLVTMASQNLPGFAVLKANGYQPPVSSCLKVTGLSSVLAAPFGSHAVCMAAITASMVAGSDSHPDPAQRWKMIYPYAVLYAVIGLAAGTFVSLLGAMPREIVATVAGLALFGPLTGGISAMMKDARDIEPALVTFLVTASGVSIMGVGAAFWGLLIGLALWGIRRLLA